MSEIKLEGGKRVVDIVAEILEDYESARGSDAFLLTEFYRRVYGSLLDFRDKVPPHIVTRLRRLLQKQRPRLAVPRVREWRRTQEIRLRKTKGAAFTEIEVGGSCG